MSPICRPVAPGLPAPVRESLVLPRDVVEFSHVFQALTTGITRRRLMGAKRPAINGRLNAVVVRYSDRSSVSYSSCLPIQNHTISSPSTTPTAR